MQTRRPVVAGRFYPVDPGELKREIDSFRPRPTEEKISPLALMLPHAGYMFCGRIIAETLGRARLPGTLILLGPNHTGHGAPLAVWPGGAWLTPFGPMEADAPLAAALINANGGFQADSAAHLYEHSLEVLLPFLQNENPQTRIVPVCVGTGDKDALKKAGAALAAIVGPARAKGADIAMLVSSDMNHFADQRATERKDGLALKRINALDPDGLLQTVKASNISMCGVYPAALALYAAISLGASSAFTAAYGTSGEAGGDYSRVVGYAGVIIS